LPLSLRWKWKLDRFREKISALFGIGKSSGRPRLCPSCGTLVGISASRCHQCGASMTFSLAAASKSLSRWMPQTSPATYAILTLSGMLFAVSLLATIKLAGGLEAPSGGLGGIMNFGGISGNVLLRLGMSLPLFYNIHEPWRFVTAIFLHGSLLHVGSNMRVLTDVSPILEEVYGSARYLFLYVATGIAGYLFTSFIGSNAVGGSGALLGLTGALLALTSGRQNAAMQMLRGYIIRWLIYIGVMSLMPGISLAAHLGGFVAGYLLGRIMYARTPADIHERKLAYVLGWSTAALVAASFAMTLVSFYRAG